MRNTCKQPVLNKQRILFIFTYILIIFGQGVIGQISEDNNGKNHKVTNITNYHVEPEQNVLQPTPKNDSSTSTGIIVSYDPLVAFEKPKNQSDVNLAFLPSFALILFIVLICLRVCVWYREEFKYKSRGCSYDITSYVILSQGDDKYRNIDIKSDTNSYETFNSISSFLRRNPQIHDTIHSTGSLQNRIDAKIYETVRSYTPILKKAHQNTTDTELHSVPAGKRSRKTSVQNSYTVSLEEKEVRIKDTRFRVVPALDNHLKHMSLRNSFKYKNRTSSQTEEGSQVKLNTGHITEQPVLAQNSEPGSPKSDRSVRTNKTTMVDAETQMSTPPPKRRRTSSRKRRKLKDTSSIASSFDSASLGDSISRINGGDSLTSTSISNSASQQDSYIQGDDKNESGLSDQQLQCDKCPNVNTSSQCDLLNGDSNTQNVVYVTALVHNQLPNGYKDENTKTNIGNSKHVAGKSFSDNNNKNIENSYPLNRNGLVINPLLRSALSYPSIVSNAFLESTNGNNNRTNGYVNHHKYYSWNSGFSDFGHKNVCTCLSTNSASKACEMSKAAQSSTCMVCYLNNHYVQNSMKCNKSEIDNVVCEEKENRNEKKHQDISVSCDIGCPLGNGVVKGKDYLDSVNYVNVSVNIVNDNVNIVNDNVNSVNDSVDYVNESVNNVNESVNIVNESVNIVNDNVNSVNDSVDYVNDNVNYVNDSVKYSNNDTFRIDINK